MATTAEFVPDAGTITVGSTVQLAYVDQSRDSLDDAKTVYRAFFQGQAMSFLAKPFTCDTVLDELRKFDLIDAPRPAPSRSDA